MQSTSGISQSSADRITQLASVARERAIPMDLSHSSYSDFLVIPIASGCHPKYKEKLPTLSE
jgi:hypothetical protein